MPNAWIYSTRVVDASGHNLTNAVLHATCPNLGSGGGGAGVSGHVPAPQSAVDQSHACVSKIGQSYHELVTYQPASRYWTLQSTELAIYVAAALLLGAFCVWWIRRHRLA